jgi:hypothetical protein
MSAKAVGRFSHLLSSPVHGAVDRVRHDERRSRVRTKVRWPVLLQYGHGGTLESVTENLSSKGFFCLAQTPVTSGETLLCWLTVPTHDPSCKDPTMVLECRVRVVRSEPVSSAGLYGIACRIEDYHFTSDDSSLPV